MLKYVMVILMVFAFAKANSQTTNTTTQETVLLYNHPASKVVEQFFVNFHAQDTTAMKKQFTDGVVLHSLTVAPAGSQTTSTPLDTFLKTIAGIPASLDFEEKLTSVKTMADDHIASVHTDYEFYTNGNLSHRGRNVFTMLFIDGQWKITQVTDTRIL